MKYELKGEKISLNQPNENGIVPVSQGGTERMYRGLMERLPAEYSLKFNFICSRVRELDDLKKNIFWAHDTFDDPNSQFLKDPQMRAKFAHLVFVSNYQFQTYNLGLGVPYHGSSVLRNAIVPIDNQGHSKPDERINIIYHTTPHRGLELLVPVFEELVKMHSNLHLDVYSSFNLYGWPQRDAPYQQLFDRCRNHPNITYHGSVSNDRIREALKDAHIFAYPSIWPETSCISAIEAMSAGCAVVAPDFAALPETLGTYGYLYRWSEDIRTHMNRFGGLLNGLINHYNSDLVQNNLFLQKRYADQHFSWDTRILEWNNLLNSL